MTDRCGCGDSECPRCYGSTMAELNRIARLRSEELESEGRLCMACEGEIEGRVVRIWGGTYHSPQEKKGCLVRAFEARRRVKLAV